MTKVIIMGGGSLGLWSAFFLVKAGYSVTVLESRSDIARMSTRANARLLSRMFVSSTAVAALTRIGISTWESRSKLPFSRPVLSPLDVHYLLRDDDGFEENLHSLLEIAEGSGCLWKVADDRALSAYLRHMPANQRFGAVIERGYRLDVDSFVDQMEQFLLASGRCEIRRDTRPLNATRTSNGIWRLLTTDGAFEAPFVVDATGSQSDNTARLFGGTVLGLKSYKRHRLIAEVTDAASLPPPGAFIFSADGAYWASEGDGRVMISPADETLADPGDTIPVNEVVWAAIRQFEALSGASVARVLSLKAGHRPRVNDGVPVVGEDPAAPGLIRAAGPSGYGMQGGPAFGMLVAAAVTGNPLPPLFAQEGVSLPTFAVDRYQMPKVNN